MTFTLLMALQSLANAGSGESEVRRRVADCVLSGASNEEEVELLSFVPPALLQRLLVPFLKEPELRPGALGLAARLRVPGLIEPARRQGGAPDEPALVELAFATQERGALTGLLERWAKLTPEDPAFERLAEAFMEREIADLDALVRLQSILERSGAASETHRERAASILARQMGFEHGSRDTILASWKPWKAAFARDARCFPAAGFDLLNCTAWEAPELRRYGSNVRIPGESRMRLRRLPPTIQEGDFTLRVRVLADGACEGLSVALREWKVCVRGDEWLVRSSLGTFSAPLKRGEWQEISFQVFDLSVKGGAREKRKIAVSVDRKPLGERGHLDGVVENLSIETGRQGAVIGGLEWARR